MTIGLTYDLKSEYLALGFSSEEAAEFDSIDTIIGIENALHELGYETERIGHAKSLIEKINSGKKWDLVFNICEGMYGIGREAQVPAILDLYNIPYVFSDVLVLSLTLHKGMTKRVIRDLGIPTADFFVVETISDVEKVNLPFPLFAKPVAEGTGKGINALSVINNQNELIESCTEKLQKFKQPVLVETYLSGREFTVGVVGTGSDAKVVGAMEVVFRKNTKSDVYSYDNKANYEQYIDYLVPEKEILESVYDVALKSWIGLGCRDGGRVDIRMDKNGIPNFIEVNPLAGLHPIDSDLPILSRLNGISYVEVIKMIMDSAVKRIN
ncbi:MAG TPA: D-alanine--D-alanine ligase [Bacteroidales bacterium]|nr:MAG: D-alanine--D-alanine ligase [Bacteroidetes bacterium GWF2_33_38]OFY72869.1 MAG: D-alanine--D-alanine ligase [Bacteroidetes bacterium RIFOXYA12_FULL_33_9]OFY91931.1 MAG: D-alanine--D-alanine ligase [Bacteroidetes bacterium RIFOXYA2_FULL_33_7]HBF87047.1 D-alanine--D-alanine ligase [Bacteroidales bacterium]